MEVAKALRALGAQLVIGSRDPARFAAAAAELGHQGVHPFIADLTDWKQVERENRKIRGRGLRPTDVIHSAAGGMEPVLRDMVRLMIGLKNLSNGERNRAHAAARDELGPVVSGTREHAMTVNCAAPARLLELVVPDMPAGGTVTFYSALWASLYPHPQVPVFYEAVAESKQAFERFLEKQAASWASREITTAIISTNLIANTRMGLLIDRFCAELMPADDRERWRSYFVSCGELVQATIRVLDHATSGSRPRLIRQFIPAPGEVIDHIAADHPSVSHPVAMAMNAPIWAGEAVRTGP